MPLGIAAEVGDRAVAEFEQVPRGEPPAASSSSPTVFGAEDRDPRYGWKEYCSCDCYLLAAHEREMRAAMDGWIGAVDAARLVLLPRAAYDAVVVATVRQPITQVKTCSPAAPPGTTRPRR